MAEPRIEKRKTGVGRKSARKSKPAAKMLLTASTDATTHKRTKDRQETAKALASVLGYAGQPDTYTMEISGTKSDPQVIVDPHLLRIPAGGAGTRVWACGPPQRGERARGLPASARRRRMS